jgi:peptidoglycan DL-endopeptidase CwlO
MTSKAERGPAGAIVRRFAPFLLLLTVIALATGTVAWADPSTLSQAKSEAETLRDQIDDLDAKVEAAVEDYDAATTKLEDTQAAAKDNQAKLTTAEADLGKAQDRLTSRVVEIYKSGHLGMLDTLVGSSSFSELINRLQLMERLSDQDRRLVDQVQSYKEDVAKRKTELAQQIDDEKQLTAEAAAAQRKVEDQLANKKKALTGKEAEIAQLEKEEAARQATLAAAAKKAADEAERQAREEEARQTTTTTTSQSGTHTTTKPSGGSGGTTATTKHTTTTAKPASGGGKRADVVEYAMKFLGVPYVWGGYSPSGFDCSGFVKYVYAHFGVSLPHSSAMQYNSGPKVSRADLKPGDLLFFYSPIHHVGMYIGNGQMINSRTGGVRIDNAFWSSYVGAVRVLD